MTEGNADVAAGRWLLQLPFLAKSQGNSDDAVSKRRPHEEMKTYLSALIDDLEKLQRLGILIETRKEVDLFLSGDWKFLAIVLGLGCASLDKGFCLWCLAGKKDIGTKDLFELRNMAEVLKTLQ